MSHRVAGQISLADELAAGRADQNKRLVQWKPLERGLSKIYSAAEGRPAYPPLVMFKALLLQQWYSFSDPELEEALRDRLSFRGGLTRFRGWCWGKGRRRCPMPRTHAPYPLEYRRRMVGLTREFEPSANAIHQWVKQAALDEGLRSDGLTSAER